MLGNATAFFEIIRSRGYQNSVLGKAPACSNERWPPSPTVMIANKWLAMTTAFAGGKRMQAADSWPRARLAEISPPAACCLYTP
jgi:hypothetical protein